MSFSRRAYREDCILTPLTSLTSGRGIGTIAVGACTTDLEQPCAKTPSPAAVLNNRHAGLEDVDDFFQFTQVG